ncbi:MAG: hypothetical protein H6709_18470 [Kofleriaceae bacterium]|nr:hypothetical protein [Kofleriaceae bacterium]
MRSARFLPSLHVLQAVVIVLLGLGCGGGDDGGTADAGGTTCDQYCDRLQASCTGATSQFTSRDQCMATCATYPQGTTGATSGNSLECRYYHAGAALGDPATHCPHAGPGGAGVCGANCDGYCQLVMATCTGPQQQYSSDIDCLTQCATITDDEPFDSGDVDGDTLACRLYHASVATQDPVTHCPHVVPASPVCVDPI